MRSGFVSIIGRPNVGKSTIVNALVGEKVAITSTRPQTTRFRIRGVVHREGLQVVLVDTPGVHKPQDALGEFLNMRAIGMLEEVDAIAFVVDAAAGVGHGDALLAEKVFAAGVPVIVVVNKIDLIAPEEAAQAAQAAEDAGALGDAAAVVKTSAVTGEGLTHLLEEMRRVLPEGPQWYPEQTTTDAPIEQRIAEIVREKVLRATYEEVPHAVACEVTEMQEREEKDIVDIDVTIYVERDSQKGIVIGSGGKMLQRIGSEARQDIEALIERHVFLRLNVKVRKDWRRKESIVRMLY